jgi:hypothetical protein
MLHWLGTEKVVACRVGRYGLIQLRRFEDFRPDVALMPHWVLPLQVTFARAAAVNAGSKHPRLAGRFLQFLADRPYNDIIAFDSDGLPPNPGMAVTDAFMRPHAFPGEHQAHEKYFRAAQEYGVGREYSPFVNPGVVLRAINKHLSGVDSEVVTVERALQDIAGEINLELRRTVERDEQLLRTYDAALLRQEKIDALKKEGKPVPLEWIDNPILRRYREAGL